MAMSPGVSPSKTKFAEDFFTNNRDAGEDDVNRAWKEAGNDGVISSSLVYKVRSSLGLTGKRASNGGAAWERARRGPKGKAKSEPKGAKGRPSSESAGEFRPEGQPEAAARKGASGESRGPGEREQVLNRVEDGIDNLLMELKQLGGMDEALDALRRVRRTIVRSHEG